MRAEPLDAETILAATEDVLRRHGPEKATVLDVARVLGVSHGSVYRHFPSKAALREAVTRRWLDRANDRLVAATAQDVGAAPERLRNWLTVMFAGKRAIADEDPELFATLRLLATEHSIVSEEHVARMLGQIRAIIEDGIAAGDFAAGDHDTMARAVFDATSRFHDPTHVDEWRTPGIEARFAGVVTLVIDGLRAR